MRLKKFYTELFNIPINLNIQPIKNELYTIGVTIPLRKFDIEIDKITMKKTIRELQNKYPHPEGVFTRRFWT